MRPAWLTAIRHAEVWGRSMGAVVEDMRAGYRLLATERYALPMLAPLAQALHASGQVVAAWFEDGAAGSSLPGVPNVGLKQAPAMRPRAVFSAANWVPTILSGATVLLFQIRSAACPGRVLVAVSPPAVGRAV